MDQRPKAMLVPTKHEYLRYPKLHAVKMGRWKPIWKQRLIPTTLILSDVLLALLFWELAYLLQGVWGRSALSGIAVVASVVPITAGWVGLRALLGLYPGYGLDSVEELRRHVYAVFATLAMLAICAVGSHNVCVSIEPLVVSL